MRKFVVATLLAGTAVATPALAQDVGPTFTGPRVEAILGYDHVGAGSDVDNNNGRDDQSIDGLLYGVGAGYDINLGSAVVGVEGEYTDSTAKSDRYDLTDQFGFGRVSQGRDLYIGARAGILASVGIARQHIELGVGVAALHINQRIGAGEDTGARGSWASKVNIPTRPPRAIATT